MADRIRANYPAMQEMAKQMDQVRERLTELSSTLGKIAQQINGGVLQGDPGEAFEVALAVLTAKTLHLAGLAEIQSDGIQAAISDMQQADSSAAGDFK